MTKKEIIDIFDERELALGGDTVQSVKEAADIIHAKQEWEFKNFVSEIIQATRYNLMAAEKNLEPIAEKYGISLKP